MFVLDGQAGLVDLRQMTRAKLFDRLAENFHRLEIPLVGRIM